MAVDLELRCGDLRLVLAPAMGGSILGLWHGRQPILRETKPGPDGTVTAREAASFPLIPFSNRIAGGRFSFDGKDYELPRDPRDTRHAMHGNALYAAWDVEEQLPQRAVLALRYRPGMAGAPYFPFAYDAWQDFTLREDGLTLVTRLQSQAEMRFPVGVGHHLYFPRQGGPRLRFNADAYWETDSNGLPLAPRTDMRAVFASGEAVDTLAMDHCFEGWNGQAEIVYEEAGYALVLRASPDFGHAVVFIPPKRDVFAFEPVTHLNDAVNRPALHGLRLLAPNEIWQAEMHLTVRRRS